jgi:hypothetical protein
MHIVRGSIDATGASLILGHLSTIALAILLFCVIIAVGRSALSRLTKPPEGRAEDLAFAGAAGIGVVAAAFLGVSAVVGPHWYTLWGTLAVLGFVARHDLAALPDLVRSTVREVVGTSARESRRRLAIVALLVIAVALVLLAIQPPSDYDSLAYHLQVPRQWLAQGRLFLPDDNYHTAFVGVSEFLYLPLLSVGAASASQVLNVLILLLLPVSVFATARTIAGARVGRVAFWLVFGSPILLQTGVTPMVDVTLTFVLIAANLAALKGATDEDGERKLILAGALLGVAAGVKYLGLLFAVALSPVMIVGLAVIARRSRAQAARALGVTFVAWMLGVAPWAVKNVIMLGNPVYPILSAPRVEPWLRPLYPDLSVKGADSEAFTTLTRIRQPFSLGRLLLAPASITSNANSEDSTPFWALFLAPVALLSAWRWKVAGVVVPSLLYMGLLLGYSRFSNLRYFIPAIPGLTVGAAVAVWMIRERLSRSGRPILFAVVAVLALPSALAYWHMVEQRAPVAYAVGRESARAFLGRYWETRGLMSVVAWVNAKAEPGAKVILLFDARGFYFDREVREDINIRNWALLEPFARGAGCLEDLGASFIVVNDASRRYFERRGASMQTLKWDAFDAFRRRCLTLRQEYGGMQVYELSRGNGFPKQ